MGELTQHPLLLSAEGLHRQPGSSLTVERDLSIPDDWSGEVSRVGTADTEEPGRVHVRILLESVLDGVLASTTVVLPYSAECVRCLDALTWEHQVRVSQFFLYPEAAQRAQAGGAGDEGDTEVARLDSDLLDLRPAFRDAALLALPLNPTCRDDCPGLCSECGFRLADDPDHEHVRTDPRWSALRGLMASEPREGG